MNAGASGRSAPERAGELLHHLLNQSLSALDFCILWQELVESAPELQDVHHHVSKFLEEADLGSLDRALALLPEPSGERLPPILARPAVVQGNWNVQTTRIREVSRADFRCRECGFEMTLAQEHPPNTEMRLPFDELVCPLCEEESSHHQGSGTRQTKRAP